MYIYYCDREFSTAKYMKALYNLQTFLFKIHVNTFNPVWLGNAELCYKPVMIISDDKRITMQQGALEKIQHHKQKTHYSCALWNW